MNSYQKKSQQLGMSVSTACHHLRKRLLFKFVQELKYDSCFKCGKVIASVDELSIEHKKVWLDVDPDLFWDLDNIAFSHLACNKAERWTRPTRKVPPAGMKWCAGHQKFHAIEEFYSPGVDPSERTVRYYCLRARRERRAAGKND